MSHEGGKEGDVCSNSRPTPQAPRRIFSRCKVSITLSVGVGNAKQAAYFYRRAFGMALIAYRGPETGTRDQVSYVVEQSHIRFVLNYPLEPHSVMAG